MLKLWEHSPFGFYAPIINLILEFREHMTFAFFTSNNEKFMVKLLEHMASAFYTPNDAKSKVEAKGIYDVCLLHTKQ